MWMTKSSTDKLTKQFSLPATGYEQDWHAELSDPGRIGEFLAEYSNPDFTDDDRRALVALVLDSAADFLAIHKRLPDEWDALCKLLIRDQCIHHETLQYWSMDDSENPDEWFNLTPHLRELASTKLPR